MNERLKKEIDSYFNGRCEDDEYGDTVKPNCTACSLADCGDIAQHFYNLALQDVKEEILRLYGKIPSNESVYYALYLIDDFIDNLNK